MFKIIKKKDYSDLVSENLNLKLENSKLKKFHELIDITIGDPEPTDTESRKMYVAKVAELYTFFSPKIKLFISRCYKELENNENTQVQDMILKGAIFAFREIEIWCKNMANENFANNTNQNEN